MAPTLRARKPPAPAAAAPKAKTKPAWSIVKKKPSARAHKRKAMKTAAPPPILDHQSYPHIFDAILSYAPHGSLLALRTASHALQKRVDLLLATHVILREADPPLRNARRKRLAPFFPPGPPKVRQRQFRIAMTATDGALPGWICDYGHVTDNAHDYCGEEGGQCSALRARWEALFATTRVVDIHPQVTNLTRMSRAKDALTNLEVVRFYTFGNVRCPIIAPTLVVFTTFSDRYEWEETTPAPLCYYDTKIVERLIVHAEYNVDRPTLPNCWVSLPTFREALREIVLLFEPAYYTKAEVNPEWTEHRTHGFLWDVANSLRVGATNRFVIVGVHDMPQELVGFMDGKVRTREELEEDILATFISWIKEHYEQYGGDGWEESRAAEIREQVAFRTFDEYREDVGEEQFRLSTVRTNV